MGKLEDFYLKHTVVHYHRYAARSASVDHNLVDTRLVSRPPNTRYQDSLRTHFLRFREIPSIDLPFGLTCGTRCAGSRFCDAPLPPNQVLGRLAEELLLLACVCYLKIDVQRLAG